jgi:hypothetical protein
MFRKWGTAIVAAALIASSSPAALAQGSQQGALAPGGSAGVEKAQMLGGHTVLILLGLGILAGGIALAVSSNGHHSVSTTTTATP